MIGDAASWSEGSHALRSQLERQRSCRLMIAFCSRHCAHTWLGLGFGFGFGFGLGLGLGLG